MKSNLNLADLENLKSFTKQTWGPDRNYVFTKFDNLPFTPFSRLEKLGACCDLQNIMATRTGLKQTQVIRSTAPASAPTNAVESIQLATSTVDAENDFHTVTAKKDKNLYAQKIIKQGLRDQKINKQREQEQKEQEKNSKIQNVKKPKIISANNKKQVIIKTKFKEYTNVKVDWEVLHESQKLNIEQHPINNVTITPIKITGKLKQYDKSFDRIDPRGIKKLDISKNLSVVNSSTLKDDILIELLQQDVDEKSDKPTVYTTDALLLALMTCKKNEFPWDILVQKDGNAIVFDTYEEERMNYMDFQSVNENSSVLPEEEKDLNKLCVEATTITKKFQAYTCKEDNGEIWDISEGEANQIDEQNIAFKYVNVNIDDKINIKVRVQIDGYDIVNKVDPESAEPYQEKVPILVRALNEFDSASQWKTKLLTQKGSVTSTEYINNITLFMKWLIQMQLSGAERLKLAYTSRASAKDTQNHNILCVDSFDLQTLTNIIQFKFKDQWQVVKYFIDQILHEKDGKYMLVKTAFKQSVKTYLLPNDQEGEEDNENDDDVKI
ncbi:hypothetical protein ABPG72_006928 [Tetrahymena utriculariae]